MAKAMRASGDPNPNGTRVMSRILSFTDSIRLTGLHHATVATRQSISPRGVTPTPRR